MIKNEKPKKEFSKILLIQESALIWITTLLFVGLAFYCVYLGYVGSLPWLTAMVSLPWTAYGVSQMMYYKKAMAENTAGGIKYETILAERQEIASQYQNASALDYDFELYEDPGIYSEIINLDDCRI